ncbi:MAG: guanylate kinase [Bacilli bacterium]|nr:guanylate kinase [Bacilli bacterium]
MIKTKKRGQLYVISGPSGCGKDTIVNSLLKKNKNLWLSISCTSRAPRGNEKDGVEYFFLSEEEFEKEIENDGFLEYAKYAGNYYGTPKKSIEEHLNNGEDVILVIEIQGALKIKNLLPETLFIFILPPSMKELKRRLEGRGTEDKEKIDKRFLRAYEEINEVGKYNYVVVNDEVKNAVEKVNAILISEKCRVDRILELDVDNIEEEIHEALVK